MPAMPRHTQNSMDRRRRLNFDDSVLKRADELRVGDKFVDVASPWLSERLPKLRIRKVIQVGREGEDVFVATHDRTSFWTSPGNTFLMVEDSDDIRMM